LVAEPLTAAAAAAEEEEEEEEEADTILDTQGLDDAAVADDADGVLPKVNGGDPDPDTAAAGAGAEP
jgi:hypothetical protein